jgi:hypothetical protein
MGSDEAGWLLLYTYVEGSSLFDSFPAEDLIELSASLQRRFPDQLVEPADPKWLREATRESLPLPPSEEELAALLDEVLAQEQPIYAGDPSFPPDEVHEYVYLVLGWLGGTVAKPAAEQVVKAAADLIGQWMRKRRSKKRGSLQIAYILGPDGKVLKRIEMPPESP